MKKYNVAIRNLSTVLLAQTLLLGALPTAVHAQENQDNQEKTTDTIRVTVSDQKTVLSVNGSPVVENTDVQSEDSASADQENKPVQGSEGTLQADKPTSTEDQTQSEDSAKANKKEESSNGELKEATDQTVPADENMTGSTPDAEADIKDSSALNTNQIQVDLVPVNDHKTKHNGTTEYRPDEVPDEAQKDVDGKYTWQKTGQTEVVIEEIDRPDVTGLTPVTTVEDLKDADGKVIGQRTTNWYVLPDGMPYRDIREDHYVFDQDGNRIKDVIVDEEQSSSQVNKVTTYNDATIEHQVNPGSVTVEMETHARQLDGNGNVTTPTHELPTVAGATVIVKDDSEDGKYCADVTLKLAGVANAKGVTITVTGPDGQPQSATLKEVKVGDDTTYTLSGIHASGLSGKDDQLITMTLSGKQIYDITRNTPQPEQNPDKPEDPDQPVNPDLQSNTWKAKFLYSDGLTGLGDAGNFSVFAKTFKWTGHTNTNVAVGEMDASTPYIGIGSDKNPSGTDRLDYSNKDLNYVGSFKDSGSFAMNNTNSYLIIGDKDYTITPNSDPGQKDLYTLTKTDADGKVQTIYKNQGNIKGIEKAETPIDFDEALSKLAEYAVNLQNQTNVAAAKSEEAKQAAQAVVDQIAKATERDSQGNKDIRIDCSVCPTSEDGTYLVNMSIDDLRSLNSSDQFIHLKNMGDKKVLINVTGLDQNTAAYDIRANIRPNETSQAFSPYNANVMFNFGNYGGRLNFDKTWYGSILAPNAAVEVGNGEFNGRLIANAVLDGHNEQHGNGENWHKGKGQETEEVTIQMVVKMKVNVQEAKHEQSIVDGTPRAEFIRYNNIFYVPNPDKPDTPDTPTPDKPDSPDTPTPDKPDTPDKPTPDKPDTPDHPTPDKPDTPDTPTPDKPDTPDTPTPDKPNTPEKPTTPQPKTPKMNVKSRTNRKTTNTPSTSDTVSHTGTPTILRTQTNLPKIEKKAKTTPHTAAFTGMMADLSALFVSAGAGLLSLIGLRRNKNRKDHGEH